MDELEKQALTEHLSELRHCLIVSMIAVAAGFAIAYGFVQEVGRWFLKPLFDALPQDSTLIFTSYQGGFFFI